MAAPAPLPGQRRPSGAALEKLHAQLRLNPQQEAAWQKIRADHRRLRQEFLAHSAKVRHAMATELAKAQPDLNHVANVQERGQVQLRVHGRTLQYPPGFQGLPTGILLPPLPRQYFTGRRAASLVSAFATLRH